jgi:POT family proton-dependent oligopeptide transporter
MFAIGLTLLLLGRNIYVVKPPNGTIITDCFKVIGTVIKKRSFDAAKPSYLMSRGSSQAFNYDDHFVDELKRALVACKVFCIYPIYWLCYQQFSTNFVSQGESKRELATQIQGLNISQRSK